MICKAVISGTVSVTGVNISLSQLDVHLLPMNCRQANKRFKGSSRRIWINHSIFYKKIFYIKVKHTHTWVNLKGLLMAYFIELLLVKSYHALSLHQCLATLCHLIFFRPIQKQNYLCYSNNNNRI